MDSPLASPQWNRARLSEANDDSDASSPLLFQWARSIKPLYRALLIAILSGVLSALLFSSLPLWRPFGMLMLHKLWDVLRFVVLTTSIGLGLLNINLWRGNDEDRNVNANSGEEESVSSKVPFVSMFYSELQPSDSFDDKEMEVGEYGIARRSESGNVKGHGSFMSASTADDDDTVKHAKTDKSASTADDVDRVKHAKTDKLANIDKLTNDLISHAVHSTKARVALDVQSVDAKHDEVDEGKLKEPSVSLPSVNHTMKVAPTKGKSNLLKARDDLGLGTVVGDEHIGKIIHRRGNSLEFPIEQEGNARRHGDIGPARDQRRRDVDTTGEKSSSSTRKAPSLVPKASDHTNGQSDVSSSSKTNIQSLPASSSASTSKHTRSRSAYDLNELLVYDRRPRSKPSTTSQLARRRNVSLSCDLDKDYTATGGVPAWLASMPSPPKPPPLDGYAGGANEGSFSGERVNEGKQDGSSLRKAYTDSLVPWRVATNAVPINIPRKEASENSQKHSTTKAPMKEDTKVLTPPSSPSIPDSFMGSPSPGELNKKVDAFIARFHERMRLQRLESLERSRQRAN